MQNTEYPMLLPTHTGMKGKCPRCGQGQLFDGYLTVAKSCKACGLDYSFGDAGDGATWFVMLFTCVVGVGTILGVEIGYSPPWWVHVLLGIPLLVLMPLALLRPIKGLLLAQQWKMDARQGQLEK